MRRARYILGLMVACGMSLCTISDPDPSVPPAIDGYHVLGADFHVHTAFGDGGLAPWDAAREAQRRGIDVIAVTNHNQLFAVRIHRMLFRHRSRALVLMGQEVTAPSHHILAVGIRSIVRWNQSAAATIAEIQARGGVAIAAHPREKSARGFSPEALATLDAAERAHPSMHHTERTPAEYAAFFARARQHNANVSPVGDSDFHFTGDIGVCRTYVLAREVSEPAVLDALRSGRTVAYDRDGNAFGDARYVSLVERGREARRAARPQSWLAPANIVGVSLVWIGLVGLILLGPVGFARDRPVGIGNL